jgi:hypothetical protein
MSKLIRDAAFLFLLVAFVATVFAAAANADPQPAEILTGIYKEAVKGATADWLETNRRGKYLSKSLLALWAKSDSKKPPEGEVGAIDFDLTTDTNAFELKGFAIKTKRRSESEDGRWRIDNFRGRGWTVREILTLWLKGP